MLVIGIIMVAIGAAGTIAAFANIHTVWWNTSRPEFVFRSLGLIAVGSVLIVAGWLS